MEGGYTAKEGLFSGVEATMSTVVAFVGHWSPAATPVAGLNASSSFLPTNRSEQPSVPRFSPTAGRLYVKEAEKSGAKTTAEGELHSMLM